MNSDNIKMTCILKMLTTHPCTSTRMHYLIQPLTVETDWQLI